MKDIGLGHTDVEENYFKDTLLFIVTFLKEMVMQRLQRTISVILLHVMTMLENLFFVLT